MIIDQKINSQGVIKITTTYDGFDRKTFEIDGDEYVLFSEEKTVYSEGVVGHDMHFRKILKIKGKDIL